METGEEKYKISGGYEPGEELIAYCPFCYSRPKHVVYVWSSDLECKVCHNHHRLISGVHGKNPDLTDLQKFYNEIGYVPTNPNQK